MSCDCKHVSCRTLRPCVRSHVCSDGPTPPAPLRLARATMPSSQEALQSAWLSAKDGYLCAREQAKAWALREAWLAEGKSDQAGLRLHVAGILWKSLGGKPRGGRPSAQAVGQLFQRIEDDPEWFPGKTKSEAAPGPKRLLRGPKATAIAAAAKRLKTGGEEPTYSAVVVAVVVVVVVPIHTF